MAIENDPKIRDRSEQVRQIQEYAERQAQIQNEANQQQAEQRLQAQASEQADPSQLESSDAETQQLIDEAKRAEEAQDVQGQIQSTLR